MSEFSLIDSIRLRCAQPRHDVALGIGDDAALLDVPAGQRLVACTDSMVEGVHFLRGTAPADIGWKALAVNLSDLAAMAAEPAWALLALTLPDGDATFVEGFANGFSELARAHDVALVGGDTTQGPLAITVTALGFVAKDSALTRSSARVGDAVFVTGTLGDAAGALRLLRDRGPETKDEIATDARSQLLARLHRPEPRIGAALALCDVASACIDVSDGLLADLGHVCEASDVGAEIETDALPISEALQAVFDGNLCRDCALAGGDDYELCFTASEKQAGKIVQAMAAIDLRVTRIGRIVADRGIRVLDAHGNAIETPRAGWEHFAR